MSFSTSSTATTSTSDPLAKYALSYMKITILKWSSSDFHLMLYYCSGNAINDAQIDHIPVFRHLIKSPTFIREIQKLMNADPDTFFKKLTCDATLKALENAYFALEANNANGRSNVHLYNCQKITEEMLIKN